MSCITVYKGTKNYAPLQVFRVKFSCKRRMILMPKIKYLSEKWDLMMTLSESCVLSKKSPSKGNGKTIVAPYLLLDGVPKYTLIWQGGRETRHSFERKTSPISGGVVGRVNWRWSESRLRHFRRKRYTVYGIQLICSVPTMAEMFMYKIHIWVIRYT